MKKTPVIIALLFAVVFSSCENENKKSSETVVDESSTTLSMPVDSLTDTAQTQALSAPGQITVSDASGNPAPNMAQPTAPAPAPGSSGGLNPEHGQPGHKCEIPVGAPLSSAPKANSMNGSVNTTPPAPTITTTPAIPAAPAAAPTVTPTVPPAAATKPGMNPPHGEPGHDCNIAVGAPLKK